MATTGSLDAAIAAQLALAIERRGLTQVQAATLLGTSVKHLNSVLHRRAMPSLATLVQWSERLELVWQVTALELEY